MADGRGFAARLGITRETLTAARMLGKGLAREASTAVLPPARASYSGGVGIDRALTLSEVYRALSIHATAASQLELIERGRDGTALVNQHAIIRRPDINCSVSSWIEGTVLSLAGDGNAFWHLTRSDPMNPTSEVVNARVVPPQLVIVDRDPWNRLTYHYAGEQGRPPATWQAHEVKHLKLLAIPGRERGLGPIQAAQAEMIGALQVRDYSALWFDATEGAGAPNGTLSTDQNLTPAQAKQYSDAWHADTRHRTRVLGSGLKYEANLLSPKDAQFLESRQFTVVQLARLFGLPASLMLAVIEGNSQSYANVEQDWIAYVRFSLMQYLREIEEALGDLAPRGITVRFNVESLLRTDTKTRFEAHAIALSAKFKTVNEVRKDEGLPPIAGGDVLALAPAPAATPAAPGEDDA